MTKQIRTISGARRRLAGFYVITFLVLLGAASTVKAAEWRFEPVVRVAGDFDDNPYLSIRADEATSETGYILEGSLEVGYASERSTFDIRPTLRRRDYGSDSDLNSDDQFLYMNFNHDTVSTNFRVNARYDRESVRTAERADTDLDVDDPDDIFDDDSGRVLLRGRRERVRVTPSFTWHASDASSVNMLVSYTDTQFDEDVGLLLTDYTDTRFNISYRRAWSPRFTALVTGTYRNYQTEQGANEINGAGLSFGIDRRMTEASRLRFSIGYENTEVDGIDDVLEPVANLSYVRSQKTTTLLAQYRRSIAASGAGSLGVRDSINLNFTRRLSEKISAGIGARVYTTNAIDETIALLNEREYVQLRARFTWHMTPTFSLQTDYRYTFIDREQLGESANANQVTVWLNWTPTPMVRSR